MSARDWPDPVAELEPDAQHALAAAYLACEGEDQWERTYLLLPERLREPFAALAFSDEDVELLGRDPATIEELLVELPRLREEAEEELRRMLVESYNRDIGDGEKIA